MIGHRSATYSDKTVATNAGIVPAPATNKTGACNRTTGTKKDKQSAASNKLLELVKAEEGFVKIAAQNLHVVDKSEVA